MPQQRVRFAGEHLSDPLCTFQPQAVHQQVLKSVSSTDCGHMFCLDCVLRWLETQMEDILGEDSHYFLDDCIIDAMRDPLTDPGAFIEASEVVEVLQLQFSCPFCRSVMRKRPIPAVALEEVIHGLGIYKGGVAGTITKECLRQANSSFAQYLLF